MWDLISAIPNDDTGPVSISQVQKHKVANIHVTGKCITGPGLEEANIGTCVSTLDNTKTNLKTFTHFLKKYWVMIFDEQLEIP